MKNANVNNEGTSLVEVNDLVLEIGKLYIEGLNYNKKLLILNKEILTQKETIKELSDKMDTINVDSGSIKKSNTLLSENNKQLDYTVTSLRKENKEFVKDINSLENENKKLINNIKGLNNKNDNFINDIENLNYQNEDLIGDIESLNDRLSYYKKKETKKKSKSKTKSKKK